MLEHSGARKDDAAVWARARRIAGALSTAFFDDGLGVVIAEGEFLEQTARLEFMSMLPDDTSTRFVTLTVPLDTALTRVERDPTRRISRDRDFLTRHYAELAEALASRPDGDLRLDTSEITLEEATRFVVRWALGK
jgi:hypothetical protein